jgi:hypothetical protein
VTTCVCVCVCVWERENCWRSISDRPTNTALNVSLHPIQQTAGS